MSDLLYHFTLFFVHIAKKYNKKYWCVVIFPPLTYKDTDVVLETGQKNKHEDHECWEAITEQCSVSNSFVKGVHWHKLKDLKRVNSKE